MNLMVFDIETIPDCHTGRRLLSLEHLESDQAVIDAMLSTHQAQTGQQFVKHHLHQIVAISVVLQHQNQIKVWSLGTEESTEADLIQRFFAGIERYQPVLVTWNGQQFDLPVLHYRALLHGIAAPDYWDTGERNSNFKYNNYLNRYHTRHTDLMDVLAGFGQKSMAKLDDIAQMLGLPGKMGVHGGDVLRLYMEGEIAAIRAYCETDVINTYLIYLRFQMIRGELSDSDYQRQLEVVRDYLKTSQQTHLDEYLRLWTANNDRMLLK